MWLYEERLSSAGVEILTSKHLSLVAFRKKVIFWTWSYSSTISQENQVVFFYKKRKTYIFLLQKKEICFQSVRDLHKYLPLFLHRL